MSKNRNLSQAESISNKILIKKISLYQKKTESLLLAQLHYWSTHQKCYGVRKHGKVWIYNTLEQWAAQLNVSKITVRRAIASLKADGFINAEYLSSNKRNRTLYYSINYEKVSQFLYEQESSVLKIETDSNNEHIIEHMYINNKQNNINKSNKSDKPNKSNTLNHNSDGNIRAHLTTHVQNMLKVWHEEFSQNHIILDKHLARFLVAAFKMKFDCCLEEWRTYLKTIKTSTYLMSEKFKLSIRWVIKFLTIDRIRAGELGVDSNKIHVDAKQIHQQAVNHINEVNESEKCKTLRRKIVKAFSPEIYISWFTRVNLQEKHDKIVVETSNSFISDYISTHFIDILEQHEFEMMQR